MTNQKETIWTFFINRRPVAWVLVFAIILMGFFAGSTLPRELQPEINIPFAIVSAALPGANPEDVETLITKPLEKEIAKVDDINSLTSSSQLGFASISIEFEADVDLDEKVDEVREKIDQAKSGLPDDASDPVIAKAEANSDSIINFSLIGDFSLYELTIIAENVQEEIEEISGVSQAPVVGGQKKEIHVVLNQEAVEGHGLSINNIVQIIESENNNIPVGIISSDQLNYSVRVDNQYQDINDIRNIPIISVGQDKTPVLLKDIANIDEVLPDRGIESRFSIQGQQARNAVSIQVYKQDGGNVIAIADAAKAKIDELKGNVIPSAVQVAVNSDNSEFIRTDLGLLTNSGIQTTILIIFILFLALGFKEGVLAGLSIPVTLLATFIIMSAQGSTINGLTLFSLVIALGLMVDTAIVIMEGIHENIMKGQNSTEAAINAVETYKWPLIAGTMTTIFAFFPMLLVSGILGEFLKALPLTISATLICSLIISLLLAPTITAKFLEKKSGQEQPKKSILAPIFEKIGENFHKYIHELITSRFKKFMVIFISIVLLVASMSLPATGMLKVEMFPQTDFRFFQISIETPKGTILEETEKVVAQVEEQLYQVPEIQNFLTIMGTFQSQVATDIVSTSSGSQSNAANITINLVEEDLRDKASYEIAQELRENLSNFTNADVVVQEFSEGPPSDAPIVVRITGQNTNTLNELSAEIQSIIEEIPGTQNIRDDFGSGLGEFKFTLNRDKLAFYGLSSIQVSGTIRNIVQGVEATEISFIDEEDTSVIVKYDFANKDGQQILSISELEAFEIPTPNGKTVTLGEVGSYTLGEGLSSISRDDQERIVKVRSDLEPNANAVEITRTIQEKVATMDVPSGYNVEFGGDTEDIEESFQDLFRSMIVGVLLIIFTLVLMFNSLRQPLIIMFTLPLALIGVFPGLMSIGLPLSFPAFLGVVALSGIVVNDAIVLIDRINKNRQSGVDFQTSIAEAAEARLQPIIMTSITTIVGILPLSLTNEFWAGLGFSLIFGLAFATVLTLVVIPVIYYLLEYKNAKKAGQLR